MMSKLATLSAIFCVFIITAFFIYMTDGVIGFHYDDVKENLNAYSYLLDNAQTPPLTYEERSLTSGLVIGSAFALAFSVLFVYLANGQIAILLLCGYFFIRAALVALLLGFPVTVGSIDIYQLHSFDVPLLVIISKLLLMWFSIIIFQSKAHSMKVYWAIKSLCWALLIYLPISFLLPLKMSFYLVIFIELFISAILLLLGVYLIQKSQRLSILFTTFIFTQFIFALLNITSLLGFSIDIYSHYPYLYTVSFWLSGGVMVFMLSRGYYYQIQDKQIAEKEALASLDKSRKAQAELLTLQEENQEQLESRVELNIALQELEAANKELAEKNTLDELTGLYNRRYYDQKVIAEHRRSRRNLTPLSLVVIDIDHFKKVNDTYGHIAGDQCLIWVSRKIKQALGRVTDLGCRYGGEEFCLILPETDTQGAISLAETLRSSIAFEVFSFDGTEIPITISCGVSTYWQQPDITPQHIFTAADQALYNAKKNGRNQVQKKILTGIPDS